MTLKTEPVISLRGVSFSYHTLPVLEQIDLDIMEGEFLGIVGPNAGGKSTLLKLMLGELEPHQGRVEVFAQRPHKNRNRIGYVPQYPNFSKSFPITVEQVVLMGRLGLHPQQSWLSQLIPGRYTAADYEAAQKALHEVEAGSLAQRQIGSLSGGQLQRVLLARALAGTPEVLILDEPTANIDQRLEGDIFDLLRQFNQRMTILVVSHDIAFISSYVTRVACINRTLVCHNTDKIDGSMIQALYGEDVRMVHHHH
ncbi:MAG: metal ABC transporter ATP-binding protein [Gammaproteobacteria bacterium]|jgi:zinc transport system ATP-binding protein|nr:metal ABC transporter ATP-binding protein [Gammaproteobacteria bacterium]MBT3488251.1 metal ABC transporter ATP-binding protein [Gammaproteobacteria bacterium]MBT3719920.1 metal ABC transporter ATP-binding protein [Gammaproteobacteria bacterium]MBT3843836.1 metal ABC transporter ATP-binding protein [Gammaproteobacteria bacterium]MBT3894230.1 metal ABC transporter ATP-binding protein [Gammaproteobacteria bacterium]